MSDLTLVSHVLLWVGFLVLLVIVFAMLRQIGILFERVAPAGALALGSGPVAGDASPAMRLIALSGNSLDVGSPHPDGMATLLFFVAPSCPICKHLLGVAQAAARRERVRMIYASAGGDMQSQEEFVAVNRLPRDSYVVSDNLGMAFGAAKLPFAVLIAADARIAALGLVNTREHLESLFEAHRRGVATIQEFAAQQRPATVQEEAATMAETERQTNARMPNRGLGR